MTKISNQTEFTMSRRLSAHNNERSLTIIGEWYEKWRVVTEGISRLTLFDIGLLTFSFGGERFRYIVYALMMMKFSRSMEHEVAYTMVTR